MKIISAKKQKEIDEMTKKKLRFVAKAVVQSYAHYNTREEFEKIAKIEMDRAEQVFYADDVIV